jgi:hypothetical protein
MIPKMIMMFTSFCVDGWQDDYPGQCLMALFGFAAAGLALQLPARFVPSLRGRVLPATSTRLFLARSPVEWSNGPPNSGPTKGMDELRVLSDRNG